MVTREATFFYDVGSPNAWFAHRLVPRIEARSSVRFRYVPILIGGVFKLAGNRAPLVAFADIPRKVAWFRREIERFARRHDLEQYRMNPHFPVNTLLAMLGAVAAEHEGVGQAYVEAMFSGMWEEGLDLSDPAVFHAALLAAGLPADRIVAGTAEQAIKDELAANTQAAYDAGAFGAPTFLLGDELYFGKDGLLELEADLAFA